MSPAAIASSQTIINDPRKRDADADEAWASGAVAAKRGHASLKRSKVAFDHLNNSGLVTPPSPRLSQGSKEADPLASLLYKPSLTTKIWGVAQQSFSSVRLPRNPRSPALADMAKPSPPTLFPEYTEPGGTTYVYRELDFWTSGFFPGCLYLLLERRQKYSHRLLQLRDATTSSSVNGDDASPALPGNNEPSMLHLEFACKWWTEKLHDNAKLTYTHDLGFMIAPWASLAWDLQRDHRAYQTMLTAAKSLYDRYDEKVGSIRSWDFCVTKRYSFTKPEDGFLVIIDNMMNLDLLFWAAKELNSHSMYNAAVAHAQTTRKYHIREDNSTCHVVIFENDTGALRTRITNQGYSDSSAWSRGQAWAIAGFAQTYAWTRDVSFLQTSIACAEFFLAELPDSRIPPWDFRAPGTERPTDTSAAVIAAYGMLLIHEALASMGAEAGGGRDWLEEALDIVRAVATKHMNGAATYRETRRVLRTVERGEVEETARFEVDMGGECETILNGATINNYEFAQRRWAKHGLVYADYYFLLFGNKILEMGLDARLRGVL